MRACLDTGDGALRGAGPLREGPLGEARELTEGEDEVADPDRMAFLRLLFDLLTFMSLNSLT